jgi:hypothetical protein
MDMDGTQEMEQETPERQIAEEAIAQTGENLIGLGILGSGDAGLQQGIAVIKQVM